MRWRINRLFLLVAFLCVAAGSAFAAGLEFADRQDAMKAGKAALEDGLFGIAERNFDRYVRLSTDLEDKAEGSELLAEAVFGLGQYQKVIELLTARMAWAQKTPSEAGFVYWIARAQFELKLVKEAEASLRTFRKRFPNSLYLLASDRLRIKCLIQLQQLDEAQILYRAAIRNYPADPETPNVMLDYADTLISTGKRDEARKNLVQLLREYPKSDAASRGSLWLGELYSEEQNYPKAEEVLTALANYVEAVPDRRASAWVALAKIKEAQTNWMEAIKNLDSALKTTRDPEFSNRTVVARGRMLIRAGEVDEGVAVLRKYVKAQASRPETGPVQLDLAQSLLDHDMFSDALLEYQNYLEVFSDAQGQARALYGKGWSLWGLKRYAEAVTIFEKAYDRFEAPEDKVLALFKAADAHFANLQYQLADTKYRRVITEFKGSAVEIKARYQAAECLARLGKTAEAEKEFRDIILDNLKDPLAEQAGLRIASMKEEKGQWEQAIQVYDQFLKLFRTSALRARAYQGRGLVRYRLGLFKDALEDFQQVVAEFENSAEAEQAFFMRGWCLYLLGEDDKALEVCEDFIKKYPESQWAADVLFWLGEYQFNKGNYEQAEKQFVDLAESHPKGSMAYDALYWAARSAMNRKEYLKAIEWLNRLTQDYADSPRLPEARFAQADALSELGQFASAILAFEEIITKYPSSYLVDLAWGRKGDCQFTLGKDDPLRYQEAWVSYRMVLDSTTADRDLKWQAEFKIGRCKEKSGLMEEALGHYMNVVYNFMTEREAGHTGNALWFTRAAFSAAGIMESQGNWKEAVNIYERVVQSGVPAAEEARQRIGKIRQEQWRLF